MAGCRPRICWRSLPDYAPDLALASRGFVIPDDVKRVASALPAHRLVLRPENWGGRSNAGEIVAGEVNEVTASAIKL